jgi:hypothetical protein
MVNKEARRQYLKNRYQLTKQDSKQYHAIRWASSKMTVELKFKRYESNARRRSISFSLTLDEFKIFWNKPCYYCAGPIEMVGLDRVDNTKGYEITNVVSCCARCNKMKNDLDQQSFLAHCVLIVEKHRP